MLFAMLGTVMTSCYQFNEMLPEVSEPQILGFGTINKEGKTSFVQIDSVKYYVLEVESKEYGIINPIEGNVVTLVNLNGNVKAYLGKWVKADIYIYEKGISEIRKTDFEKIDILTFAVICFVVIAVIQILNKR